MSLALNEAKKAYALDEVPVGSIIVKDGEVISSSFNQVIAQNSVAAHAEINVIVAASKKLNNYRLTGCELYVTIEPCTMCVGAMVHARIKRVIFGALEPRAGALKSQLQLMEHGPYNHSIVWDGGVLAEQCGAMMADFFRQKRDLKNKQTAK